MRFVFGIAALMVVLVGIYLVFQLVEKEETKWNVLVLVPDTVRGDHLSVNGYHRATTPNLDRLAGEGVNFSRTSTVAPRTWQSFCSILTGVYPPKHGVRYIMDDPLRAETPTMASELANAGYDTAAFDTIDFLEQMTAGAGFDRFESRLWFDAAALERAWLFMNEERDRPFLAFVRLTGTHWPYDAAPEELQDLDPCDGKSHAFNEGGALAEGLFPKKGIGFVLVDKEKYRKSFFQPDPSVREHTIAHYDAKLRRVDGQIGGLLDRMRESGLYERTIVVLTSDHGESFGEHGYLTHGPRVDQPVMHVPMIIRLPSTHPSYARGTRTDIVRTVDILPTVLTANGLSLPRDLDGVDLLPVMRGEPVSKDWAYAEAEKTFVGVDPEQYVDGVPGKHRMIRRGNWKLIYIPHPEDPIYRLYDLENDPGELRDVATSHPQQLAELKTLLASVLVHDTEVSEQRELTESEKEQLRQLGYM